MKRLVYLISTFLILTGMYGGSVGAKDHDNDDTASSSGSVTYCYDSSFKLFYKWFGSRCSGVDKKISKQEYSNHRLVSSGSSSSSTTTTASSSYKQVWCATKAATRWLYESDCKNRNGKAFLYEYQAEAEHKRLKAVSSTAQVVGYDPNDLKKVIDGKSCPDCNLQGAYLSGADLSYAHLIDANLKAAQLEGANLFGAKLAGAALNGANLKGANLQKTDLYGAELSGADLTDADLMYSWSINNVAFVGTIFCNTTMDNGIVNNSGCPETASSSSSTASATTQAAQTATTQPSTVDKSALDLEFWQSVKDQNNADMYRAYIDQFPDGVYVVLAKIKLKALGSDTPTVTKSSIPDLNYGDYYALVIGNNDYELLPDLKTAVNDATKVASVLKYDYGFEVELLTDATRSDILKSLRRHRKKLREEDNFLIYYAGHGDYDEDANKTGYWLPVDATRDDASNWVMTDYVVNQITAMQAKHVMVVADSCFSGELTRGIKIDYGSPSWIQKLVKKKARIALTSGGLEPVSDSGGGSHSVFAKVFISLLEENTGVLNTQKLFTELRPRVMKNTRQTPEHGTIHLAGDDGGDFLFVRR